MMTKKQFMDRLKKALSPLPAAERREILSDYEEHFVQGAREGLSEDEICRRLGDPENIAREYVADSTLERADSKPNLRNTTAAILTAVGLGALNIFLVLPVYLTVLGIFLALFGIVLACVIVTAVLLFFSLSLGTLFLNAGFLCLELLIFFGLVKLIQLIFRGAVHYIRANVKLVKEGKL